ncbi:uncharacterized protein V1513DRAFT_454661 [Lipomyces chichibuensis]|uniref:uncharacterized protein n=1 Tax=Lipomyces chichibuensis TaxID=1546026 RepID=UPI0033431E24
MTAMDQIKAVTENSPYCRRCSSCRCWIRCTTIEELQQIFSSLDGRPLKSCQKCRANKTTKTKNTPFKRTGFDLDITALDWTGIWHYTCAGLE